MQTAPSPIPPLQDSSSGDGSKKRKIEAIHVMQGKTLSTEVHVNGTPLTAIIDSGATTSAISKRCVPDSAVVRNKVFLIQVGNGETIFSEGVRSGAACASE